MVVICEECGKVYKLDADKLKSSMKGKTSKIKCRVCDHVITIALTDENTIDNVSGNIQHVQFQETEVEKQISSEVDTQNNSEIIEESSLNSSFEEEINEEIEKSDSKNKKIMKRKKRRSGMGLRTKMLLLFLLIPSFFMLCSGMFSQNQMLKLASDITAKSTEVVKTLAEESIINKAKSVASQCSIFLKNNPDLNKDDFYYDLDLNRISIQKVGLTDYTALVELPDQDKGDDSFIIWCHHQKDLVGKPLLPSFKKYLGLSYDKYRDIINTLRKGKGNSGYYTWTDEKGITKEKFIAVEPIEQSKYAIISTTFIEDFTTPINDLKKAADNLTEKTKYINVLIFIAVFIIIILIISIYGYRLSKNIGLLTDAADRISVGELDVIIEIRSNDEIGALAEAISRMQDSLRFSIERLRRRR
jgi:HAMP domain-containing protein